MFGFEAFDSLSSVKLVIFCMAFCTKCGGEIKKSWKHCPVCGQEAAQKSTSTTKISATPKETPIAMDAIPAIKGVPIKEFKTASGDANGSTDSGVFGNSEKKYIGMVGVGVFILILIIIGFSSGSSSDYTDYQSPQTEEVRVDPEVEKIKAEKNSFDSSLSEFLLSDCKPTITKAKGSWENLDTWVLAGMTLDGVSGISTFPERYQNQFALSAPKVDDWGNSVDKTLMVVAAYEKLLAPLYYEIFEMWSPWGELGKFKGQFNTYFNKVDGIAKKLCYGTNPAPTESQLKNADKYLPELVDGWFDFVTWTDKVWARESELSDELDYETTPRCTETKTNNPNYNIVTCTNLP
jgi:hypothetical protein